MDTTASAPAHRDQARRGFWLRELHRWHWISAALSLVGLLVFAVTGFTLNHAGAIESRPVVLEESAELPPDLLPALAVEMTGAAPLPSAVRGWLAREFALEVGARKAEWSADEIYLSLPRPGGDAWLSIDRADGAVHYEKTRRGAIAWLNDLHKGRNTGAAWSWFIDLFALACVVFALTGLFLLKMHAANRPMTWPVVGFGLLLPAVLVLLFIH